MTSLYTTEHRTVTYVSGPLIVAERAEHVAYDERRTAFLASKGLRVLRFWNMDVLTNPDGVRLTILNACEGLDD